MAKIMETFTLQKDSLFLYKKSFKKIERAGLISSVKPNTTYNTTYFVYTYSPISTLNQCYIKTA